MVEKSRSGGATTMPIKAPPEQPQEEKLIRFVAKQKKEVQWVEGTIDNEFMNKKKSKST